MKKEIILAVIIGLIVGLVITFGVYRAQQAVQQNVSTNAIITETIASPQASPQLQQTSSTDAFTLTEPADEALVSEPSIRMTGQTIPNATIVILGGSKETIGSSDSRGNFSIPHTLQVGSNILTVRVLSDAGETKEVVRTVIYSTADLSASSTQPTPEASPVSSPTPTAKGKATPTPKTSPTPKATVKPTN